MDDLKINAYVTNLGKYNEGELVGEWVRFPITQEELSQVYKRIGIDAEHEEIFITDYDINLYDLGMQLDEYESLDKLNYLAGLLKNMSVPDREKYEAVLESGISVEQAGIDGLINLAYNLGKYDLLSEVKDEDDLGRYYAELSLGEGLKEKIGELADYIDFERYGSDCQINEAGMFTDAGYMRDTGEDWNKYFDGSIKNIPEEYRLNTAKEICLCNFPIAEAATLDSLSSSLPFFETMVKYIKESEYPKFNSMHWEEMNRIKFELKPVIAILQVREESLKNEQPEQDSTEYELVYVCDNDTMIKADPTYINREENAPLFQEKLERIYEELNSDKVLPYNYYGHRPCSGDVIVISDIYDDLYAFEVNDKVFLMLPESFLTNKMKKRIYNKLDVRQESLLFERIKKFETENSMHLLDKPSESRFLQIINKYSQAFEAADNRKRIDGTVPMESEHKSAAASEETFLREHKRKQR